MYKKRKNTSLNKLLKILGIIFLVFLVSIISLTIYIMFVVSGGKGHLDDIEGIWSGTFVIEDNLEKANVLIHRGDNNTRGYITFYGDMGKVILDGYIYSDGKYITVGSGENKTEATLKKKMGKYLIEGTTNGKNFKLEQQESGSIIGNPFYVPSINGLTLENIMENIKVEGERLGLVIDTDKLEKEDRAITYKVNDYTKIYFYRTKGGVDFIKGTWKVDDIDKIMEEVEMLIEVLVRAVNYDFSDEEIEKVMTDFYFSGEDSEYNIPWEERCSYYPPMRYDFDITEDKGYEFHIESGAMSY